jgi:hypothetical protein
MKHYWKLFLLLCMALIVVQSLSVYAQNRNIRVQPVGGNAPNRPNRPTPTPRPQTAGLGTSTSAITYCDAKVYFDATDSVIAQGFAANASVLVTVPSGGDQLTFWWRSDQNGSIYIDRFSELVPNLSYAEIYDVLLIGANGPILGHCANLVEQSPQDLYNYYRSINPIPPDISSLITDQVMTANVAAVLAAQEFDASSVIAELNPDLILVGSEVIAEPEAQTDPNIPINEGFFESGLGVSNSVTNSGGDLWNFSGTQGDMIRLTTVSDQFDTYLTLYDSNLNVLFEDDDSGGNLDSLIDGYMLPYSGDYIVNVRAYDRVATGTYMLLLELLGSAGGGSVVVEPMVCGGYTTQLVIGGQAQRTSGSNVRIRANPSRSAQQIGLINNNTVVPVLAGPECVDNIPWWQVNYNGIVGWAAETADGQVLLVPVGAVPVATAVSPIMPTPTVVTEIIASPPPPPATNATLNFSLPPNYGSVSLTSGFSPDPYTVGMSSGGSVDVSYLGGGCIGFATSAPDFRLQYTSGSFSLIRIYFVGSGDTTLIINDPGGGWHCVDDSFGTLNPTVDFSNPASGQYDIWVGSYSSGTSVGGTLSITELDSNHP